MLTIVTDLGPHEGVFLDLEASASLPYSRFVYGTPEQATIVRRILLENRSTEFAPPHSRLLLDGGRPVGMMACLRGSELLRCRLQAAWVLKRSAVLDQDPATERALHLASQTLLKPQADDYYLSRIAILPDERGRGLARRLLQRFEAEARDHGCTRLVLEVEPANVGATHLYLTFGFETFHRVRVVDEERRRELEYAHWCKKIQE